MKFTKEDLRSFLMVIIMTGLLINAYEMGVNNSFNTENKIKSFCEGLQVGYDVSLFGDVVIYENHSFNNFGSPIR